MEREKPHYISLGNSYATVISRVEFHTSHSNQLILNVWISISIFFLRLDLDVLTKTMFVIIKHDFIPCEFEWKSKN